MTEICLLLLSLAVVLALVLAIVVVLKNGKFHFLCKKDKKEDALLVKAEHQDNLDKWLLGASAPIFITFILYLFLRVNKHNTILTEL